LESFAERRKFDREAGFRAQPCSQTLPLHKKPRFVTQCAPSIEKEHVGPRPAL